MRHRKLRSSRLPLLLLFSACAGTPPPPAQNAAAPEPPPPPRAEGEFEPAMLAVLAELKTSLAQADQLVRAGKLDQSDALLLGAIARERWNGVHYFVFGNLYFAQRDDLALEFLTQAYRAYPEEPRTNLEYALIQHRTGNCAAALPAYERALAVEGMPSQWHAVRAECLLREGQHEQAVRAWAEASYETARVAIDRAIHAVHGERRPMRRWYGLRKRIEAGEVELAGMLVQLDTRWDHDWWNIERNADQLRADLRWLEGRPGITADDMTSLRLYAELMDPKLQAADARAALQKSGLVVGEGARLPKDSLIASGLFVAALQHGAATREALHGAHGAELQRRSEAGDVEALNGLAFLSAEQSREELIALERAGWERHGDARFAAGLLGLLAAEGKLGKDSKLLAEIRTAFPDDAKVQSTALEVAITSGQGVREAYVAALAAEFTSLSRGHSGLQSSDRLNTLMDGLRVELGVVLPPPPTSPRYELQTMRLVGDELHAVVETYVTFRSGRSNRAKDFRGYLVVASVTGDAVRVYGPLWDVPDERSALSYEAGTLFTEQDRHAAAIHPRFAFDDKGRLVAWTIGKPESGRVLELAEDSGRWQPLPQPSTRFGGDGEGGMVLALDRMQALRKGRVGWRLVRTADAGVTRDRWLEQVARDLEKRAGVDLGDSELVLDASRKHVLVIPSRVWSRPDPADPKAEPQRVESFRIGRKEYKRAEHGLYYRRPGKAPRPFTRQRWRSGLWQRTDHVLAIDGKAVMLVRDMEGLRLADFAGKTLHVLPASKLGESVGMNRIEGARYDGATGTLRVGASWLTPGEGPLRHVLAIIEWPLKGGDARTVQITPDRFLVEQDGELAPVETTRRPVLD